MAHIVRRIRSLHELVDSQKPWIQRPEFWRSYRVCIHEQLRRLDQVDFLDDDKWLRMFSNLMLLAMNAEVYGPHPKKLLDRIKELGYFDDVTSTSGDKK